MVNRVYERLVEEVHDVELAAKRFDFGFNVLGREKGDGTYNRPKTIIEKREVESLDGGSGVELLSADCLLLGVGAGEAAEHSLIDIPLITRQHLRLDEHRVDRGESNDSARADATEAAISKVGRHWIIR